jgi:hypothetical protein
MADHYQRIFFNRERSSGGNKVPNRQITPMQRIIAICTPDRREYSDAHKNHSGVIAAHERHYRRFCQPARWFLHSMRPKESALAGSVHAGRLVITK